jgi:hypothetical protein
MELPAEVAVHNELLGMKGSHGTLLQVHRDGYYELNVRFGERVHRVLLPITATVIIASEAEAAVGGESLEVER